jgi:hypothetical protein
MRQMTAGIQKAAGAAPGQVAGGNIDRPRHLGRPL